MLGVGRGALSEEIVQLVGKNILIEPEHGLVGLGRDVEKFVIPDL